MIEWYQLSGWIKSISPGNFSTIRVLDELSIHPFVKFTKKKTMNETGLFVKEKPHKTELT